jgi:hypothetical protein
MSRFTSIGARTVLLTFTAVAFLVAVSATG